MGEAGRVATKTAAAASATFRATTAHPAGARMQAPEAVAVGGAAAKAGYRDRSREHDQQCRACRGRRACSCPDEEPDGDSDLDGRKEHCDGARQSLWGAKVVCSPSGSGQVCELRHTGNREHRGEGEPQGIDHDVACHGRRSCSVAP